MRHLEHIINLGWGILITFALVGLLMGMVDSAVGMIIITCVCWASSEIIARAIVGMMYFSLGLYKKDEKDKG
jgi:hypothetical protein